ncbi:MAG: GNAT family N-acetyltransferase [Actinomycetota bacterium]
MSRSGLVRGVSVGEASLADKPTVANLLELYQYDFSEFVPADIDERGRFGYPYLDAYWTDDDRFPFLIWVGHQLAGSVLIRRLPDGVMVMAEFFVMRRYRREGVGRTAAVAAIDLFRGEWSIGVFETNAPGQAFWRDVLEPYSPTIGETSHDGDRMTTYRFTTSGGTR